MSSEGGGKARDKRSHRSKPYQRRQTLLGRLGGTVSRLLPEAWMPSWLRDEHTDDAVAATATAVSSADMSRPGPSGVATRRQHLNSTAAAPPWSQQDTTDGIPVDDLSGIQLDVDTALTALPSPIVWPRPPLSAGSRTSFPSPPVLPASAITGASAGQQRDIAETSTGPVAGYPAGVMSRAAPRRGGGSAMLMTSSGAGPPLERDREPAPRRAPPPALEESLARKRRRRHQHATDTPDEDGDLSEDSESPSANTTLNTSVNVSLNASITGVRPQPSALSSKRPRFNPAALNASLMSQDGNTLLNRSSAAAAAGQSPMYPGPTVYGGAANHRRLRVPPPTAVGPYQVRARPVAVRGSADTTTSDDTADLSTTARRILSVLERMSTPVEDARRMAVDSAASRLLDAGFLGQRRGGVYGAHGARLGRRRERAEGPPVHRVVSPMKVALESNRSVSARPVEAAQVVPATTSQLKEKEEAAARRVTFSAPAAPAAATITGGKMRRQKERGHYSRAGVTDADELPSPVQLPDVSLPFSGALRPFSLSTSTPIVCAADAASKRTSATTGPASEEYAFASPQMLAAAGMVNGLEEVGGLSFTFSAPKSESPAAAKSSVASSKSVISSSSLPASTTSSGGSLFDKFKPAAGSWECPTCMVSNKPDAGTCVACQTACPTSTPSKPAAVPSAQPALPPLTSSWGDKFKPVTGQWSCDTCMVGNKPEAAKCIACETPKPGATPTKVATSSTATATAAESAPAPLSNWGDKFKHVAGEWSCDTCMVTNKPDVNKCVACETPNPKAAASTKRPTGTAPVSAISPTPVASSWGDKFKPVTGEWTCDTCMVKNKPDTAKCVACETPNPNTKSSAPAASNTSKAPESWECSTCLVRNQAMASKCIACESPRPGNRVKESSPYKFGVGSTSNTAAPAGGGFKFGFGEPSKTASTTDTSSGTTGFVFSTPASQPAATGFSFGFGGSAAASKAADASSNTLESKTTAAATPALQFTPGTGSSAPSLKRKSTGDRSVEKPVPELKTGSIMDVLGKSGSSDTAKTASGEGNGSKHSAALPANGDFKLASAATTKGATTLAASPFAFGTSTTRTPDSTPAAKRSATPACDKSPPAFAFGAAKTDEKKDSTTTGVSFGAKPVASFSSDKPVATAAAFSFGSSGAKASETAGSATFAFGAKATEAATTGFSLGTKTTASCDKPTSGFSFGAQPASDSSTKPAATFSFGAKASDSAEKLASPGFSFGSSANSDKPAAPPFAFGSSATEKSDKSTPAPFTFGDSSSSAAINTTQSTTPKPSSAVFSLGSASSAGDSSASKPLSAGFTFGASAPTSNAPDSKPASAGFAFGAPAVTKSGSSTALFTFGATSVNGPTAAPAPVASAAASAAPSGVFQFGAAGSAPAPAVPFGTASTPAAASPFSFGAKSAASATRAAAAPATLFGSAVAAPASTAAAVPAASTTPAVFTFGTSAARTTSNVPAPFAFGAGSTTGSAPASGVFQFGATPGAPAAPSAAATPAFGSSASAATPTPSAGFSFGSVAAAAPQFSFSGGQAAAAPAATSVPGIFQFGPGSSAAPAATPSPFGAPPAAAQSANPFSVVVPLGNTASANTLAQRKIRTARRRVTKK